MYVLYHLLDIFFIVFHSCLILFNLTGWIWHRTRRLNLLSLVFTAFSWLVLGIWYGIGYCPCTDWHWQIRHALGKYDMPHSYIKFLVDMIFKTDVNAGMIDILTACLFSGALICSVFFNLRDR